MSKISKSQILKVSKKVLIVPVSLALNTITATVFVASKVLLILGPIGSMIEYLLYESVFELNSFVAKHTFKPFEDSARFLSQIQRLSARCFQPSIDEGLDKEQLIELYGKDRAPPVYVRPRCPVQQPSHEKVKTSYSSSPISYSTSSSSSSGAWAPNPIPEWTPLLMTHGMTALPAYMANSTSDPVAQADAIRAFQVLNPTIY